MLLHRSNVAALHLELQPAAAMRARRAAHDVCSSHRRLHFDHLRVKGCSDQIGEGRRQRLRPSSVMQQRDRRGIHQRPETPLGFPRDMNAVSRDQLRSGGRFHKEPRISVLYKEQSFVSSPVDHGCIERDRKTEVGLRIGEVVDGRNRVPCNRLRCKERAGKYRDDEQ